MKGATAAFGERSHIRRPGIRFRPRPPNATAARHRLDSARAQMKWLEHFARPAESDFRRLRHRANWTQALDEMVPGPAAVTSGRRPKRASRPGKVLTDLNQKIPPNDGDKPARARREPRHDARWEAAGFSGAGGVTGAWKHGRNPNSRIPKQPRGAGRLQQLVRPRATDFSSCFPMPRERKESLGIPQLLACLGS